MEREDDWSAKVSVAIREVSAVMREEGAVEVTLGPNGELLSLKLAPTRPTSADEAEEVPKKPSPEEELKRLREERLRIMGASSGRLVRREDVGG